MRPAFAAAGPSVAAVAQAAKASPRPEHASSTRGEEADRGKSGAQMVWNTDASAAWLRAGPVDGMEMHSWVADRALARAPKSPRAQPSQTEPSHLRSSVRPVQSTTLSPKMDGPAQSHTDTCRYQIHLPNASPDALPALAAQMSTLALSLSKDYIWHHPGGLALAPSNPPPSSTIQPASVWLEGSTNVTDAVDDEWLLVWLLVQLSQKLEGAVVGVSDEDGEFLLIEGADELPRWLTPDNATNRVSLACLRGGAEWRLLRGALAATGSVEPSLLGRLSLRLFIPLPFTGLDLPGRAAPCTA